MLSLEQSVNQTKGIWVKVSAVVSTTQILWLALLSSEQIGGLQGFSDVSMFMNDFLINLYMIGLQCSHCNSPNLPIHNQVQGRNKADTMTKTNHASKYLWHIGLFHRKRIFCISILQYLVDISVKNNHEYRCAKNVCNLNR